MQGKGLRATVIKQCPRGSLGRGGRQRPNRHPFPAWQAARRAEPKDGGFAGDSCCPRRSCVVLSLRKLAAKSRLPGPCRLPPWLMDILEVFLQEKTTKGFHDLSRCAKRKPPSGSRGIMPDAQQKGGWVKLAGFATLCPRGGRDEQVCRNCAVARAFCRPLVELGEPPSLSASKCPSLASTSAVYWVRRSLTRKSA